MIAFLNSRLTNDVSCIKNIFRESSTYFKNDVIRFSEKEFYFDVGAYDGTSIKNFIDATNGDYEILAAEVLPDMFEKLRNEFAGDPKIKILNIGLSDHVGTDYFDFNSQGTILNPNGQPADVTTTDEMCKNFSDVSLIKICIGNSIIPLLKGAAHTLSKSKPKLIIAAGIDNKALSEYVKEINSLSGNAYKYFLRFTNAMPESLVLYALPKI